MSQTGSGVSMQLAT